MRAHTLPIQRLIMLCGLRLFVLSPCATFGCRLCLLQPRHAAALAVPPSASAPAAGMRAGNMLSPSVSKRGSITLSADGTAAGFFRQSPSCRRRLGDAPGCKRWTWSQVEGVAAYGH
ncbi:predicted protein [Chaetomium globosum CBS 148.51]|uniref:Secreted protein n=1 Tax=Chaetomium globosum (strain ATCC 6205 / CBS 148.51 / DSM 1962 / NBRC 6347 / NRRL 1970) TaxID=306901 RepID=Q2HCV4_CHAGB|nr:uncharacterized protein CHGG_01950 [Chaetomium globosum CBS 148.51]EAQ93715.1 predicted protein [Chaetomium globosum CBS 148.51]